MSIRAACLAFRISQACYRYEAKHQAENDRIMNLFTSTLDIDDDFAGLRAHRAASGRSAHPLNSGKSQGNAALARRISDHAPTEFAIVGTDCHLGLAMHRRT